jgi:mRNA-degrading endonuclease RelE of RelBE toxin-antitoxin system
MSVNEQPAYEVRFRSRVWDFRIIYLIDEEGKRIEVGEIGRRSERTYKGFEDLFR